MPRFFFDIDDGGFRSHDEHGQEFVSAQAARDAAVTVLPAIAKDILPDADNREFTVEMRDDTGKTIFTATLGLTSKWLK